MSYAAGGSSMIVRSASDLTCIATGYFIRRAADQTRHGELEIGDMRATE